MREKAADPHGDDAKLAADVGKLEDLPQDLLDGDPTHGGLGWVAEGGGLAKHAHTHNVVSTDTVRKQTQ